jgi:PKD repeat protein
MKTNILMFVMLLSVLLSCKKDDTDLTLKADFSADHQEVLAGDKIVFSDLTTGQPSSWSWEFEGGTPAVSDLSGPEVTYSQPGTYAVTLTVKNSANSSVEKKTAFVTVGYRDVVADFTASAATIRQGEEVTFTDNSTGMPTSWEWEFKSGATVITSTLQNPVIKFETPGIYDVTLKVTNPKGTNTVVKAASLNVIDITAVEADFTSDYTATYTGGKITFTDSSVGTATAWNWTFEGAATATSTSQNPEVTYNTAGRFKVRLVASNSAKSSTIEKEGYILVVPGNGISAFYPLNGGINDVGPSKLQSTAEGTIAFTSEDRTGKVGNTGVFNGSGGFVVPDNNAMNFGTGDYTISVWMKTNTTIRGMIWQESGRNGSGDNQTWLRILGTATNLTSFSTEDQTGGSTINLTTAANGAAATTNDNVWHHIVCVRSGAVTAMYIDGVKIREATSSTGTKITSNEGNFKVGMQENTSGYLNKFNGLIDDLVIYKRALNASEITTLKNL